MDTILLICFISIGFGLLLFITCSLIFKCLMAVLECIDNISRVTKHAQSYVTVHPKTVKCLSV